MTAPEPWLFEAHFRLIRELFKLQVASRVRLAHFKFSVARLGLQALNLDGLMANRARLPRLTISATSGKRLPHIGEPKSQRD